MSFEILSGKKASIRHLRIFGCQFFAKNLVVTGQFASRAIPSILMGYSDTQRGYKLYDLINWNLFVSIGMFNLMSIYPFKNDTPDQLPIFFE